MKIENWSVERPIPYEKNARKISDKAIDKVAASLREYGWRQPIVVDGKDVVIAGHTRLLAAKRLKMDKVPVHIAKDLTPAQVKAYRLMDNRSHEEAEWMPELLGEELLSLQALEFDLSLSGFDEDELADLMSGKTAGGLTDEDATPGISEAPASFLDDMWMLGSHRLLCGDSTDVAYVERLMNGAKADMVFTDPPYGYSYESNHYKGRNPHGMLKNDDSIVDFLPVAYSVMSGNSAIYLCASHQTAHLWRPLIDRHFTHKNLIVWKKNNWSMGDLTGSFAGQHELIFFAHKGTVKLRGERSRDVWEFDRDPPTDHPTQKPVDLVAFAVEKVSDKRHKVLDLFGGSGSTLIACEKTGRKAYLMELDPKYCDVIVQRWQDFTGKKAVLEGDGRTFDELKEARLVAA